MFLKRLHCFMRATRNYRNYEYCITVPGTLFWDCRYAESINKDNRTVSQIIRVISKLKERAP